MSFAVCLLISLIALCCEVYRIIISQKLQHNINNALPEIEKLITNTHQMLNYYDRMMLDYSYALGKQDIKYLVAIRKILGALEDRHLELVRLLRSRKYNDTRSAHKLLESPLIVQRNGLNSIIDSSPIPPIKPEAVAPTIEALFEDFESESSLFQFGIRKLA